MQILVGQTKYNSWHEFMNDIENADDKNNFSCEITMDLVELTTCQAVGNMMIDSENDHGKMLDVLLMMIGRKVAKAVHIGADV